MPLTASPALPEIRLHTAHPASGLWRLADGSTRLADPPPYWAYVWGGGVALARYLLDHPERVAGRRVLDLGAGSGVAGIAAAKAGAKRVIASEVDPNAVAALKLNAAANGVAFGAVHGDLLDDPPPPVDLVVVGDLFYDQGLAERVSGFLGRCAAGGIEVLVGDPRRTHLPRRRLRKLAEYPVADFGEAEGKAVVFAFEPTLGPCPTQRRADMVAATAEE